jgi:hypothetical protein
VSIGEVCLKLLFAAVGLLAIFWSVSTYQRLWPYRDIEAIGYRIVLGDSFKVSVLEAIEPVADQAIESPNCNTPAMRGAVFVKVHLYELKAAESDRIALNKLSGDLRKAIGKSLGCSPYDPFFWFVDYWMEVSNSGISEKALRLLQMSYATGPHEGWIALRRNRFALAAFPSLKSDLQQQVLDEFADMVEAGFVDQAAANLAGPGWPIRDKLLERLAHVRQYNREVLARLLENQGVRLEIPNVETKERRYWN